MVEENDTNAPGTTISPEPIGPRPMLRRRGVRLALLAGIPLALILMAGGCWLHGQFHGSLPLLEGELVLPGLAAPVTVERDALGIPTIRGGSRLDVARATGFLHAQERFFQMDLMRRHAAGEMAALAGAALLPLDRHTRIHRLRAVAERVMRQAPGDQRALIKAYHQGVNAGLAALRVRPFEYLILRAEPEPWRPEDTVLVLLSLFLDLQDESGVVESTIGLLHEVLPGPLATFLAPRGTEWDAPVEGGPWTLPPIPGPEVYDLRAATPGADPPTDTDATPLPPEAHPPVGSNNWAVAGAHTANGGALLANDMHLGLSVPNIWYRASFVWPDGKRPGAGHRITGATLPGTPGMVVGSNGRVAWGFTNSYVDWSDLVVLEPDPEDGNRYLTPEGPRPLERAVETIHLRDGTSESLPVVSTIWGPVVDRDHRDRRRAIRWVAHDPGAVDLGLLRLETAAGLDEALDLANRCGVPALNLVVADATGRIGWTIAGRVPRRLGFDGRLPGSWADGTRRWDGWRAPEEVPRIVDPPGGRIWITNARVVEGEKLSILGDGGYDLGARAVQIRDGLRALDQATPRDMLSLQLDDRSRFLARWRDLLRDVLTPGALAADPRRVELRRLVVSWDGHASVDAVGHRLVRAFRMMVYTRIFEPLTAACREADSRFAYSRILQAEGPLWALVTARPPHLLDPRFADWDALLLDAVDALLDHYLAESSSLSEFTWGRRNTVHIQHALSRGVPLLGRWLDMDLMPLPGDNYMPRVQSPTYGASQRMVVSPGREEEGIFHMPCGQSGHPLSPHYRDGHAAWMRGDPTPFLPGPTVHTLTLRPGD